MDRFWAKIIQNNKIVESLDMEGDLENTTDENMKTCLEKTCNHFDLSMPVFLPKHKRDWTDYKKVTFTMDDFIDEINFDKFEFELVKEKKKKKNFF